MTSEIAIMQFVLTLVIGAGLGILGFFWIRSTLKSK